MKVIIEFRTDIEDFDHWDWSWLVEKLVKQSAPKAGRIVARLPCACDAPEDDDLLRDINGNRIGTVKVER